MKRRRVVNSRHESTAGIARMVRKSARLVHLLLCYIYGAKMETLKNMTSPCSFVVDNEGILRPKAIKNEFKFRKWTTRKLY